MATIDTYNHAHTGKVSTTSLASEFDGHTRVLMHSCSLPINYLNISTTITNQVFYYNPTSFILIPQGCYSLITFNRYLKNVLVTALTRVELDFKGINFQVVLYANITDFNNGQNGVIQSVSGLSLLNQQIYFNRIFYDRIKLVVNILNSASNENGSLNGSSLLTSSGIKADNFVSQKNFILIPIQSEPGQIQHFSFYNPLVHKYSDF